MESNDTELANETTPPKPFDLLEALLKDSEHTPHDLPQRELGKQLRVAKRLIEDGVFPDEVEQIAAWLRDDLHLTGVDMFTIEKFVARFRLRVEPKKRFPQRDDWRKPGQLVTV